MDNKTINKALNEAINTPDKPNAQESINIGLTRDEVRIVMLMLDGLSHREIARKLNMNTTEFNRHKNEIKQKLKLMKDSDPAIAVVSMNYNLTKRETEILSYLRNSKTNNEIATELFLSEETVKVHVHNLMKKIPVNKRNEIPAWLDEYEAKKT